MPCILCPQGLFAVTTTVPHLQTGQMIPMTEEFLVAIGNMLNILLKQFLQTTTLTCTILYTPIPACALIGIICTP